MPIKAVITVNEKTITTIQIGRISGNGMQTNDVNTYAVVETDSPLWSVNFEKAETTFEHKYGDGVSNCVAKAIEALEKTKTTNPKASDK
jgi:hypothetical protein